MRALGKFTTALMVTATVGAFVLGILSIPDVRRYLKMRQM